MIALLKVVFVVALAPSFGVTPNPQPPSVHDFARYAPTSPDLTFYVDVGALLPRNYQALKDLAATPLIQDVPAWRAGAAKLESEAELGRGLIRTSLGIDPLSDLESITLWWKMADDKESDDFVLVARGHFPADLVDRIAKMAGKPTHTLQGHTVLTVPDERVSVAMPKPGVLLVTTPGLVDDRLQPSWKPPHIDRRITRIIREHPAIFAVSKPSTNAIDRWRAALAGHDQVIREMILDHQLAAFSLSHHKLSLLWQSRSARGFERAELMGRAVMDLTRATHLMSRGMGWVMLAGLTGHLDDDYMSALASHRQQLRRLMVDLLGLGDLRGSVTAHKSSKAVRVQLKGPAVDAMAASILVAGIIGGLTNAMRERHGG